MGLHSEATLDRKFLDLVKLLNIYLNHFPKSEKYGLALQIRQAVSLIGHARHTHSQRHMLHYIKDHNHALHHQLP